MQDEMMHGGLWNTKYGESISHIWGKKDVCGYW